MPTAIPPSALDPFVGGERYSANQPYFNAASPATMATAISSCRSSSTTRSISGAQFAATSPPPAKSRRPPPPTSRPSCSPSRPNSPSTTSKLRTADAQQKLLNDTVTQYEEAVRITNNRFDGGVAAKSDRRPRHKPSSRPPRVAGLRHRHQRAQYEHAIAVLIGKPPAVLTIPCSPLPLTDTPPVIPAGLPSRTARAPPRHRRRRAPRRRSQRADRHRPRRLLPHPQLQRDRRLREHQLINSVFSASSFIYAARPHPRQTFFDGGRRRGLIGGGHRRLRRDRRQLPPDRPHRLPAGRGQSRRTPRPRRTRPQQQRHATAGRPVESERIFNNRYVGGVDTYLQVITAQTTALNNERNDIDILRRRMDASVLLIKALGGGWDRTQLPKP